MLQVCAVDFTAYHMLRPLMHGARDAGWSVEFACAPGQWAEALSAEGFRFRRIPVSRAVSPPSHLRSIAILGASIHSDPPDLVHTHTPVGGLVGRLAAAAAGFRPVVHTFHGLAYESRPRSPIERAFLAVERVAASRTAFFFSQGTNDLNAAVALGIARAGDSLVIGNGVDLGRFAPDPSIRRAVRAELGVAEEDVVVLTVARLIREKGILDLAEAAAAMADLRSVQFFIVGTALSSDRTSVVEELSTHRVHSSLGGRWRELGHRLDVDRLLNASDMYVLPSYREGLPRSAIEAMAVGVPVVLSRIPAGEELVLEGQTGILVTPGSVPELMSAIWRLATDTALRQSMGKRAREIAEARHNEKTVIVRQLEVLKRLIGR
jgi:glycosyltransferase involved in cell wall biosynthesis